MNILFPWHTWSTNLFTPLIDLEWTWKELCELAETHDNSTSLWEDIWRPATMGSTIDWLLQHYLNIELLNYDFCNILQLDLFLIWLSNKV